MDSFAGKTPDLSLYVAFDTYPAPKGAAVHIREFAGTLFEYSGRGILLVLGNRELPVWQIEQNVEIRRFNTDETNFLKKTMQFYHFVRRHTEALKDRLKIVHFRDPWGGLAVLDTQNRNFRTVYEVNGLPSVELPSRYSGLGQTTLDKIRRVEMRCLQEADFLLCPSVVTRKFLLDLDAGFEPKLRFIRNGAHIPSEKPPRPAGAPEKYIIYSGALQSWQGVEVLLKSMRFLRDFSDLYLVLCVFGKRRRLKFLSRLYRNATGFQNDDRLIWQVGLEQQEHFSWLANAEFSIAPLCECRRNLVQGCCPLKIIESMSFGVPVIASDMPVTRELIEHGQDGWLLRPDRPSELARAIRLFWQHPERVADFGDRAAIKIKEKFSWAQSRMELRNLYEGLCFGEMV
jgi:glycosyltransferase involved in cell wall biosynthesis